MAPLTGVTVIDLSRYLPGPLTAKLLADLGARVLKVEEPRLGDPVREAPPWVDGQSTLATLLLSGAESLALDLKREPARRVLDQLLADADVLLSSFRPGTLERLGLGPERLRERFPRLVVCSITGWGTGGPYAHRAGHDLGYQALAGVLASTASELADRSQAAGMPAVQTADLSGAWAAASSVLAALYRRERDGRGTVVDVALYEAALHANLASWAGEAGEPAGVGAPRLLTGAIPCYALYRASDGGLLAVAALERKFWRKLCHAVGRRELVRLQYRNEPQAFAAVADLVAGRSLAEWTELAEQLDLPIEPVLSAGEALAHPQAQASGVVGQGEDGLPRLGFPALFDGRRLSSDERFPELGAATEAVLTEHGLGAEIPGRLGRRRKGVGRIGSLRRLLGRGAAWWLERAAKKRHQASSPEE